MRNMVYTFWVVFLGVPSFLVGAEPNSSNRVALAIGNSQYDPVLRNPSNDADAVEVALKDLGFSVLKEKDLTRRGMRDALVSFRRKLTKGGIGLFFYAGHGIQVKGENYLVPINAQIREEFEAREECVNVSQVLEAMAEAEVNLKVLALDCCRDNPLQRSWKRSSFGKGLAGMQDVPVGTLIAFSTSPNRTAADGTGNNSPYTEQLVSTLRSRPVEGLELSELFREASRAVKAKTGQVPWLNQEASLEKYYLWKSALPQRSPNPTTPPPPEQIEVAFRVRDGSYEGPELQGVEAQLRHRVDQTAAPAVLGLGITDAKGLTRIKIPASEARRPGMFEVVLSAGGSSITLPLKEFPRSLQWTLWLPRVKPSTTAATRDTTAATRDTTAATRDTTAATRDTTAAAREKFITNSIGIRLALLPAGEFTMGSDEGDSDAKPAHRVRITKAFYLGVTEVTQGQYEQLMGVNPSEFNGNSQRPVEKVSWMDAMDFCRKLSARERKQYRLPTEAEWEYACRAGSTGKYHCGDSESRLGECAWYKSNSKRKTSPVGQKKPNAWGLYDMHGKNWEQLQQYNPLVGLFVGFANRGEFRGFWELLLT